MPTPQQSTDLKSGAKPAGIGMRLQRKIATLGKRAVGGLLQEVNHRASNNLQIAASILTLHARATTSPEVRMELKAAANRIGSIGLVHELLYKSNETEIIDIALYFGDLIENIRNCYSDGESATFALHTEELASTFMHPNAVTKLGIIVTELLTNAVKYAGSQAACSVTMSTEAGNLEVRVSDNGPGMGAAPVVGVAVRGLGTDIVKIQLEQLNATMTTHFEKPGAHFVIVVPQPLFAE